MYSPYFYSPKAPNPDVPLFVFLPGMDETGKALMNLQTASLYSAFDVRCFVIPADNLTNWDDLSEQVVSLTQAELSRMPRSAVYLCGESFGGCLALKVILKAPQLSDRIILINSASSFHQIPWLNFGSMLFPYTPDLIYDASSIVALPFLANLGRLKLSAFQALCQSAQDAPKQTAAQRLKLMRMFEVDEQQLHQFTQPVLLIAGECDRLLPSVAEAHRLAKVFPAAQVVTLPHSGHACLIETDINLLQIIRAYHF